MSKKDQIIKLVTEGQIAKACKIARKFFYGLSADDKRFIEITADCADPKRAAFYNAIGTDTEEALNKAEAILRAKYF